MSSTAATPSQHFGGGVLLHPLAVLNMSDHSTRAKGSGRRSVQLSAGALLGKYSGASSGTVDITAAAEFPLCASSSTDNDEASFTVDVAKSLAYVDQLLQVMPSGVEVVGWYALGATLDPSLHDTLHHVLVTAFGGDHRFLFVLMNPAPSQPGTSQSSLPLSVFETKHQDARTAASQFSPVLFSLKSDSMETVALDAAMAITETVRSAGAEKKNTAVVPPEEAIVLSSNQATVAALTSLDNAINSVTSYLENILLACDDATFNTASLDAQLLRSIASLCNQVALLSHVQPAASTPVELDVLLASMQQLESEAASSVAPPLMPLNQATMTTICGLIAKAEQIMRKVQNDTVVCIEKSERARDDGDFRLSDKHHRARAKDSGRPRY